MRTLGLSICALGLLGCSLTTKLSLPSLSHAPAPAPYAGPSRSAPAERAPASASGPMAIPVVRAAPAPASYAWCSRVKSGRDLLDRALTDDDPDRAIPAIVQHLCHPDGEARAEPTRSQLETRRRYWMQRLAMSETDWAADVPEWAAVDYSIRNTAHVPPEANLPWSATGPVEQFALLAMKQGDSKAFALQPGGKTYIADAVAMTQAGRVAFIAQCIHTNWDNEVKPVEWAMCQPDIDALDAGKFAAELRADTAPPPYDRMVIRVAWANLAPKLAAHAARVKQLRAKDEVYDKLFSIARETHKEWASAAGARAELLSALRTLDDARATGSRKALARCGDRSWKALGDVLGRLPAKDFIDVAHSAINQPILETVGPIVTTPEGYLAATAYVACASPEDPVAKTFATALHTWSGFRGPRTATLSKLRMANLQPDRRGDELAYPEVRLPGSIGGDYRHVGSGNGTGVVKSVTTTGDTVRVQFVEDIRMIEVCTTWRISNRLSHIDEQGRVHYQSVCTARQRKANNFAPAAATFHKRFAAGVTKGATLVVMSGVVVASYPKLGVSPTTVLGTSVK